MRLDALGVGVFEGVVDGDGDNEKRCVLDFDGVSVGVGVVELPGHVTEYGPPSVPPAALVNRNDSMDW